MSAAIPTLDIRRYDTDRDAFVAELGAAYREWGFAGIRGHGISNELIDGAYERLLGMSTQVTTMPFVTPGDPANSYLWLKLNAADGIVGAGMPVDPLAGVRTLSSGALTDIQTWIMNGAKAED